MFICSGCIRSIYTCCLRMWDKPRIEIIDIDSFIGVDFL